MVQQLNSLGLDLSSGTATESELPATPSVVYMDVNVVPEHDKEGLASTISSLQGMEMSELRSKQIYLDAKRREALDKILDIKGSIRVFCRVKLMDERKAASPISTEADKITVRSAGTRKEFVLDRVFHPESTQEDVFREVKPILRSALDGHNVCILAYGQTGTGKTHTMEGNNGRPGIVPRAIEELFHQISRDESASFTLSMSMLEVYMGSLRDLFVHRRSPARVTHRIPKCNLSILRSSDGTVEIEGLTDVQVTDVKQARRWYARGKHARSTSWTNVNDASSRSHCLTRITISRSNDAVDGTNNLVSKIWLVDLGGSERLLKTGATGQTLDEGRAINLSLSALADVIAALRRRRDHIPYRNSKLTQLLSDSLGDGSKVLMIVHVSPGEDDAGETVCSLSFATRVRAVEASRELSEDTKKRKQQRVAELEQGVQEAEEELRRVRDQMERTAKLIQEKTNTLRVDLRGSPRSPLTLNPVELDGGDTKTAEKPVQRARAAPVPRFMSSTACSRRRQQQAAESLGRARRRSTDLRGSQSHSCYQTSKKMTVAYRRRDPPLSLQCNPLNVSHDSVDSRGSWSSSKTKKVSNSNPNLRVALHQQHRRRMSDLI
uniref:Kinesin motor domain-containing protein n=1 Tax=Musa acuminata subsp. malaccensis TaxID=214687 RepID=A0A804K3M3_MUSAM|nr:PREDICTED: kinesin-like calmodulin-binding protein isoform X2 [Musa acuminata subsp. malaccensis]